MYNPPNFLTVNVLSNILKEFEWPDKYRLEDDLPDGISMVFENCELIFSEGFESEIHLLFSVEQTGTDYNLELFHALQVLRGDNKIEPKLSGFFSPLASLEKVENEVRDICVLLQFYLLPCISGDFSWVDKYLELQNDDLV